MLRGKGGGGSKKFHDVYRLLFVFYFSIGKFFDSDFCL